MTFPHFSKGQQLISPCGAKKRNSDPRRTAALSRDCGGRPTGNAIWKILQGELRGFPDADTIQGLAKGLKVPARKMLHAYARSLGSMSEPMKNPIH